LRFRAIAALIVIAGAAGWWWWRSQTAPDPLDGEWPAIVSVAAGDGVSALRDGTASRARFSDPFGIAVAPDGAVYVADAGDAQRIRRIGADGSVTSVAGSTRGHADGAGSAARFDTPSGLAIDAAGTIYVADTGNNSIRRLSADGRVWTIAGSPQPGFADGSPLEARFNGPVGVAVDRGGRVIVADTYNDRIRAIDTDGRVFTLAGSGVKGFADGAAAEAQFDTPCGVAVDAANNVYIADTGNGVVRVISDGGTVGTLDPLPSEGLVRPVGIAIDARGVLYVTDDRGHLAEIVPGRRARTLAGSRPGFADGAAEGARFRGLAGIAVRAPGHLLAADGRNALVRSIAAPFVRDLHVPVPGVAPAFDSERFAREPILWPLAPMDGPFEITGTLGELRGGEGTERFHAGVDIHAPDGEPVLAVRPGTVAGPLAANDFGTLNESVRIGPLAYVHLRVGRFKRGEILDAAKFVPAYDPAGRLINVRVKRGARFETGEPIGTVNDFNHVHLNVGWPGEEHNPLEFRLVRFEDSVPPTISRRGIRLFDTLGQPLTRQVKGRILVSGIVHAVVDAWDQVNGNLSRRRLGLYALGYQVLNRDGTPVPGFEAPRETIRFDRLDGADPTLVYASGSGIPFYGRRRTRFLYRVTNALRSGSGENGWDTTALPPGDYTLRIVARDVNGNEARSNRDLAVTVAARAQ
jgi:sugar lactone lactonase YvrE